MGFLGVLRRCDLDPLGSPSEDGGESEPRAENPCFLVAVKSHWVMWRGEASF